MKEEGYTKIDFFYTDEFGQESRLVKTFTPEVLEVTNSFDLLFDEFINFMKATGFSKKEVDKIKYVENDDE